MVSANETIDKTTKSVTDSVSGFFGSLFKSEDKSTPTTPTTPTTSTTSTTPTTTGGKRRRKKRSHRR